VHAVLQRIDLAAPDGLDDLAREFATREGCLDFVDDVASLVLAATSAPIVRAAAASGSLYRELPLTLSTPGGFVEGVVDLCFEGPDGLVIVDYKTDVVVDETDARQRADRYRLQAGAYAWAVGSITDRRVARVVFLFLAPPDGSIECAIEEVEAVIAEAKAAVAVAVSRDGTPLDHDRGP
jgi:ATP-dependent helicase/nuclease subunit A